MMCTKFNGRSCIIMEQQQQKGIWLPLLASIGVGAATFYSMTRNGKGFYGWRTKYSDINISAVTRLKELEI